MRKRAGLLMAVMIPLSLALTACGPRPVRLVLPPASLATCAGEPQAPALPGREKQAERDALTLDYILGLRSAWGDCKSKVDGLAAWRERAGE